MKKLILLCILIFAVTGCIPALSGEKEKTVLYEVTDSTGTKITFYKKPERIISLSVSTDEILSDMVSHDRIVAITRLTDDPGVSNTCSRNKDIPGRILTKSAEEIISFRPDLVICPDFVEAEIYEQLRLMGIPVYVYPTQRNLQDIKDSIYHIGEVTGEKERAAVIISDMEEKLNAVRKITEKIPPSQRKRVAYFQTNGVYAGRERCFDDLCRAAGLTSVTTELPYDGLVQVPQEQIMQLNPDAFVFINWNHDGKHDPKNYIEEVFSNPAYKATNAGKNHEYYLIDGAHIQALSHYAALGVEDLAKAAYPDLFKK